ncbi:winged helix-turn-helix domain-containing protein [Halobaculum limi]|uniref:winged helix-turn-helix domain-containing protein n=1 Tax=Halobaculum limi TaxID=3031916 RepID=UPI002406D9A1|nr:helix-turn-helix domain-containing protein [Halobaculum sp. YSMS11]
MDDEHPSTRTFEVLSNEVRLRIITALGDASGLDGYATLAFSEIQRAADIDDSGQLTYHLGKLCDKFVEETDGGYKLTLAGIRAYQAILALQGGPTVEVDPVEVDRSCEECGAGLFAWYTDGRGHIGCRACGTIDVQYPVEAALVDPENPESVTDALDTRIRRDHNAMFHGSCPYCGGATETTLKTESDYWEAANMNPQELLIQAACTRCSWFVIANAAAVLRTMEPVRAFYAERGVDIWSEPIWTDVIDWVVDDVERDPIRIHGHLAFDGDHLRVTLSETFELLDQQIVADA